MKKTKELLAAGIVRDMRFKDQAAYNDYLLKLQMHKQEYEILERCPSSDGSILARILVQYNDTPLIRLYD